MEILTGLIIFVIIYFATFVSLILLAKRVGINDEQVEKYVTMINDLAKIIISGLIGYIAGKGGV